MIHLKKPDGFVPDFYVVGCFIEAEGEILLLERADNSDIEPGKWGTPGEGVEANETAAMAILREIEEEIGLTIIDPKRLELFAKTYGVYPKFCFVYFIFILRLRKKPEISLDHREHKSFLWRSPQQALLMDLMLDEDFCIKHVFGVQ